MSHIQCDFSLGATIIIRIVDKNIRRIEHLKAGHESTRKRLHFTVRANLDQNLVPWGGAFEIFLIGRPKFYCGNR